MSPRAAWRLESLGFPEVYDYAAGAADWFANRLPREGRDAAEPRAGDAASGDVPRCGLDDRVGDVRDRTRATGWDTYVVVNGEGVVLGRLRETAFAADPEASVEQVMESGPTTVRPSEHLESLVARMHDKDVESIVVTTSDGRLVGVLRRADAEQRLERG